MTSIEFIKAKLNMLVSLFPTINCAYEFDSFDNTHTVEVSPSDFYNNTSFCKNLTDIDKEFILKFPFEGLFFIDDKDLMPIKNVNFEIRGKEYELHPIYSSASFDTVCIPDYVKIPSFLNSLNDSSIEFIKEVFITNSIDILDSNLNSTCELKYINDSYFICEEEFDIENSSSLYVTAA